MKDTQIAKRGRSVWFIFITENHDFRRRTEVHVQRD